MIVYVVVTHYMYGIQDEAVFSSREKAKQYLASRGTEGNPEVIDAHVQSEMKAQDIVFTASWYDRISDIHNFKGVYGSYEEAKQVAGEKGSVLSRRLDERIS